MFQIEDERHAEPLGQFASFEGAMEELRRWANVPWGEEPNVPPCEGGEACHRVYEVVEYDPSWREISRLSVLEVSSEGAVWHVRPDA